MRATFKSILEAILGEGVGPNEYEAGRKTSYPIPDAISDGQDIIEKEGDKLARAEQGAGEGDVEMADETEEAQDGAGDEAEAGGVPELTIDDLSAEGSL